MPEEFPMGSTVTFVDGNHQVTFDDEPVVASGTVNGIVEDGDEFVPVWVTERKSMHGGPREPTTVFVHRSNVLGVKARA